uniref:Selenoprotein T1b n=1 Tax=Aceria tosichella TaxID=561515 RepID=A0A6G1SRJ1_9ACAR
MIEQNTFTIIFGVFLLLTCRDMFFGHSSNTASPDMAKPVDVLAHHHHHHHDPLSVADVPSFQGVPTIKIQYCHSCGYKQAFDEISKLLVSQYPNIKIEGQYHQPNWLRSQIVNLLFISKIAIIAMIYMDINPFTYLQMETPRLWTHMTQSKVPSSLIILFITNSIESNMMSTGAFEIFYNDMPVWSKLTTGRMPTGPELMSIVSSHYKLGEKSTLGVFNTP